MPASASTAESQGFPAVSPKLSSQSQESPHAPSELVTPLQTTTNDIAVVPPATQPPGDTGTASENAADSSAHELEPVEPVTAESEISQVEEILAEGTNSRANPIISTGSSRKPSHGSKHRRSVRNSKDVIPDLSEDERRMSGGEDARSSVRVTESEGVTLNLSDSEPKSAGKENRKQSKKSNGGSGSRRPKMQSRDTTPNTSEDEGKRSGKEQRKPPKRASKAKQSKKKSRDVTPNLSEDERTTSDSEHRTQSGRHSLKSNSKHSRKQSGHATPILSEDERRSSHTADRVPSRVAEESDASDSDTEGAHSRITPVQLMDEEPTTLIGRAMQAETLGASDEAVVGSRDLISRSSNRNEVVATREDHGHGTANSHPVREGGVEDVSPAHMRLTEVCRGSTKLH